MSNCTDGNIRLVDGNTLYEGRVEVCINGAWGTVCSSTYNSWWSNYRWSTTDSKVVCRQLGHMEFGINSSFSNYLMCSIGSVAYPAATQFGQGTGPIFISDVHCTGQESNLFDCSYRSVPRLLCTHNHDVGVKCEGIHVCICCISNVI